MDGILPIGVGWMIKFSISTWLGVCFQNLATVLDFLVEKSRLSFMFNPIQIAQGRFGC
jgi:hypothetical protein